MSDFYFPHFDLFDLDETEQSLAAFMIRLRFIEQKAEAEFDYVFTTWRELSSTREAIAAELVAMRDEGHTMTLAGSQSPVELPLIYTPGLATAELREQSALLRAEASAGSLILMLDDIVQRLRRSVWSDEAKEPRAATFALCSLKNVPGCVTTLIYAAGNAYRHAKDWDGLIDANNKVVKNHPQFGVSKDTLAILEPTIGFGAIGGNMTCIASLTAMSLDDASGVSFASLWERRLQDVASEFAAKYCPKPDAFERITEAMEYQDSIGSMEVSFSMDERLFNSTG